MYWLTQVYPFAKLGKNFYFHGSRKMKRAALTFDDGPSDKTKDILDVLNKYAVRATFFLIGKRIADYSGSVEAIVRQGSEIGNHSYSHFPLSFKDKSIILNEINKTKHALSQLWLETNLFRPPHGSFGLNLISVINDLKMKCILWDIDPKDWSSPGSKAVVKRILNKLRPGAIIDLHEYAEGKDQDNDILEILNILIPEIKKRGYSLVKASEIIS